MVTVVDGSAFLADFGSTLRLAERGQQAGPDDDRGVVDLLCEQVEFADVIVVSKVDQTEDDLLQDTLAVLRGLNRDAKLLLSRFGDVPLAELLDTGRFDYERAQRAGLGEELRGEHTPETEGTASAALSIARDVRSPRAIRPRAAVGHAWRDPQQGLVLAGQPHGLGGRTEHRGRSDAHAGGGFWYAARDRVRAGLEDRAIAAAHAAAVQRPRLGTAAGRLLEHRCRGRRDSRMRRAFGDAAPVASVVGIAARSWW